MDEEHQRQTEKSIIMRHYRYAGRKLQSHHIWKVLMDRLFPLLSLTYIAAVIGLSFREATSSAGIFHVMTQQQWIYGVAFLFMLWVAVPCVLWISIRSSIRFPHLARSWYWMTAGFMLVSLLVGWILVPEVSHWVSALAATVIPMHVVCYVLLCLSPLPRIMAWPIFGMGMGLGFYGSFVI